MKTKSLLKKLGMLIMCLTVYININAECPPHYTLPFEEKFNSYSDGFPSCWTTYYDYKWSLGSFNGFICALMGDLQYNDIKKIGWMVSPSISLPSNSTIKLEFLSATIVFPETCRVNISTGSINPEDGEFTTVRSISESEQNKDFIPIDIDLSAYAGKNIYIGFEFTNKNMGVWFVKDVKVHSTITSIQDVEAQDKTIQIYPNPVTEIINIESSENILKLEIINMEGKKIQEIENPGNRVDLSCLSQGVYIIKIKTEAGLVTKRIIKQ